MLMAPSASSRYTWAKGAGTAMRAVAVFCLLASSEERAVSVAVLWLPTGDEDDDHTLITTVLVWPWGTGPVSNMPLLLVSVTGVTPSAWYSPVAHEEFSIRS